MGSGLIDLVEIVLAADPLQVLIRCIVKGFVASMQVTCDCRQLKDWENKFIKPNIGADGFLPTGFGGNEELVDYYGGYAKI